MQIFRRLPCKTDKVLQLCPQFGQHLFVGPQLFLTKARICHFDGGTDKMSVLIHQVREQFRVRDRISGDNIEVDAKAHLRIILDKGCGVLAFRHIYKQPGIPDDTVFNCIQNATGHTTGKSVVVRLRQQFHFDLSLLNIKTREGRCFASLPSPSQFYRIPTSESRMHPPIMMKISLTGVRPFCRAL